MARCDVSGCPERFRCLDLDTPGRCALYRMDRRMRGKKPRPPTTIVASGILLFEDMEEASRFMGDSVMEVMVSNANGTPAPSGAVYEEIDKEVL